MPSKTQQLAEQLIRCASVTPHDAGCQTLIREHLARLGFHTEPLPFGDVTNLWARWGTASPLLVFAGHTDVVPPGPLAAWTSPPFEPTVRNGMLYGRGATDMKSGLAAMLIAVERFLKNHPHFPGSLGFLITSDEEGPSIDGTRKVMETLRKRNEKIDYCIIGEATSHKALGDQIRIGRRGSLHGRLIIHGKQGHIAYPSPGTNPIHLAMKALLALIEEKWDEGDAAFPATSFQLSNIHAGTGATNVTPGTLEAQFNFRFGTALTVDALKSRVASILNEHQLPFELEWNVSGEPFLTKQGRLINAVTTAIQQITQRTPILSTGGGTSDGRFIAPSGAEVIELGPLHASAHQVDEHVNVADLDTLTQIYEQTIIHLFR